MPPAPSCSPRSHRPRRLRRWFVVAPLLTVSLGALGTYFYLAATSVIDAVSPYVEINPMSFDSAGWREAQPELSWESVRLRMVDDLLETHPLIGVHREQVVELIGEPDDTPHFRTFDMVYYLGQERSSFAIDSEWLVIQLDDDGIVTEAKIVRD